MVDEWDMEDEYSDEEYEDEDVELNEVEEWRLVLVNNEKIVKVSNLDELKEEAKEFAKEHGFKHLNFSLDMESNTMFLIPEEKGA